MCTILDAAEERGVNRGETLKLIMMVQKKIKKGDIVGRISYGKDIYFIVERILKTQRGNIAILKRFNS